MDKKENDTTVKFKVGDLFQLYKIGGNDIIVITEVTPAYLRYVLFNNWFGMDESVEQYSVTRGRTRKRMLGNQNYNTEYCKRFDLTAKAKTAKSDILKLKYIPLSNHEISLLTNDELDIINDIGLTIVTTD